MSWPKVSSAAIAAAQNSTRAALILRGSELREMLEAAAPYIAFAPFGDNHHNAALCPYCTPYVRPSLEKEIDPDQEVIRVDGDLKCPVCGVAFHKHMTPLVFLPDAPTIRLACSGVLVKL